MSKTTTRERGFMASYKPRKLARVLIEAVQQILIDEADYLPLTLRQVFYRLVVKQLVDKTERGYTGMLDKIGKARRARIISMDAIRDDGFQHNSPKGWDSTESVINAIQYTIDDFTFNRQSGQENNLVVWCEATGMIPQLQRVANDYSVPVYSSGGFDSITTQHNIGKEIGLAGKKTIILHLGDFDPSGVHMFSSLEENVMAFAGEFGVVPEFVRLAVTPEQIVKYGLPTAPVKVAKSKDGKDKSISFDGTETTQCEALPPAILAKILREAIETRMCMQTYQKVIESEALAREELTNRIQAA